MRGGSTLVRFPRGSLMRYTFLPPVPPLLVAPVPIRRLVSRHSRAPDLPASGGGIVHRVWAAPTCATGSVFPRGMRRELLGDRDECSDDSVTGRMTDRYGPADGLHAVIDCLKVGPHPNSPGGWRLGRRRGDPPRPSGRASGPSPGCGTTASRRTIPLTPSAGG